MDKELLFEIYRVRNNESDEYWNPAILDVNSHDVSPLWISGVLFAIYSRYMESIPDNEQLEYEESIKTMFKYFVENGHGVVERVKEDGTEID